MTTLSAVYLALVEKAVPFFQEHGTVDLVDLAEATSLGFQAETFTADVYDAAQLETAGQ